jgi:outer membrane protein assembly factor BamD (BamD/ComL family)
MVSCQTGPPVISPDLLPAEFFQKAQEEADNYNWDNALAFYTEFLERFPEDEPNVIAAEYEIAFIYYKKGDTDSAKSKFSAVIQKYEDGVGPAVPDWPLVLAKQLLNNLAIEELPAQ